MDDKYWDLQEYEFFDSLSNIEKLIYLYELMIDDYDYHDLDDEFDDEFDDDNDSNMDDKVINSMDSIKLTGEKIDTIKEVAEMIMMNGIILRSSDVSEVSDNLVSLSYNIIGKTKPICLN